MTNRDADKVGWAMLTHFALDGDEPPSVFYESALSFCEVAAEVSVRCPDREASDLLAEISIFMGSLVELLDEGGKSEIKANIVRRKAGKPVNKHARARTGRRAGLIAEKKVSEGWKTEAAIEYAMAETGLSRAEVFSWLRSNRNLKASLNSRNNED